MSHKRVMKTAKITNLRELKEACAARGIEFRENQKQATYWRGQKIACDHVIHIPGSEYEVAVIKKPDGTFELQADDGMCQKFTEAVGYNCGRLGQEYTFAAVKNKMKIQGYSITKKVLPNGKMKIICEK